VSVEGENRCCDPSLFGCVHKLMQELPMSKVDSIKFPNRHRGVGKIGWQ
jgi:hypothetical protein